jgi:hypothetical protein
MGLSHKGLHKITTLTNFSFDIDGKSVYLGIIRIEEVAPAAQTHGRFDSEALLALRPQARRSFSPAWPTALAAPVSLNITVHHDRPSIQGTESLRSDVPQ